MTAPLRPREADHSARPDRRIKVVHATPAGDRRRVRSTRALRIEPAGEREEFPGRMFAPLLVDPSVSTVLDLPLIIDKHVDVFVESGTLEKEVIGGNDDLVVEIPRSCRRAVVMDVDFRMMSVVQVHDSRVGGGGGQELHDLCSSTLRTGRGLVVRGRVFAEQFAQFDKSLCVEQPEIRVLKSTDFFRSLVIHDSPHGVSGGWKCTESAQTGAITPPSRLLA